MFEKRRDEQMYNEISERKRWYKSKIIYEISLKHVNNE